MGISLPVLGVSGPLDGGGALPSPDTVANLAHWYNVDDLARLFQDSGMTTPVAADGDPVGAWVDQIVSADEIAQATTSAKPTYRASVAALNNKPALQFDGGDWLRLTAFQAGAMSYPLTLFVVGTTTGTAFQVLASSGAADARLYRNSFNWNLYAGSVASSGGGANNNPHIFTALFNGAGSQLWVDGVEKVAGDIGANAWNGFTAGAYYDGGSLYLVGYEAEALLFADNLSDDDKNTVQNYLANKYGISVTEFG